MKIIGNGRVLTRDASSPWFPDGAVVIDGNEIKDVGSMSSMKEAYPDAEFIDARGGVIMPGFINAHTHIYSGLARGLSIKGNNPRNFYEVLDGTWWAIDRRLTLAGTKASAYATALECIRNGVTTIFDHHASFCEIPGSLFAIKDVLKEMGVRACLCYEVSERDGEEKTEQSLRENEEFITWAIKEDDDMIKAMFGGHALFTISDRTFQKMVEMNGGRTGFHIHVAEGMNDVYDSMEKYGCLPVERLMYNGLLGEKTLLGHCIHLSPGEMDIIKETGTMVVNNPESNMGNAVGCAPVLKMFEKGITVGMGTDAYTHDMLESLKVFLIIQRHNAGLPSVAWGEDVTMLFENNRKICEKYFRRPLGILRKGAAADVVVMDYPAFTPFSNENADGHMIFGMEGHDCTMTMIDGKVLYKDREFTLIDREEKDAFIMEESIKLWGDLNRDR